MLAHPRRPLRTPPSPPPQADGHRPHTRWRGKGGCTQKAVFLLLMEAAMTHLGRLRIPAIVTTRSDGSRPPVPIDRDQFDGAVRCIF